MAVSRARRRALCDCRLEMRPDTMMRPCGLWTDDPGRYSVVFEEVARDERSEELFFELVLLFRNSRDSGYVAMGSWAAVGPRMASFVVDEMWHANERTVFKT
jgi:hypothetical protein